MVASDCGWKPVRRTLTLHATEDRHRHECGRCAQDSSHDLGIRKEDCQNSDQRDLIGDDIEAGSDIITSALQSVRAMELY